MSQSEPIDFSQLELQPSEVDLMIYHGGCVDGFGSALACHEYFKLNNGVNSKGKEITYFNANFNKPPPDVKGLNVLICDFSYDEPTMKTLIAEANMLAVLDHHKTAEKNLINIDQKYKIFRMDHSGAYLAWTFFFRDTAIPLLIRYIEDTDIWTKVLENTDAISAYIHTLPFDFEEYSKLLDEQVLLQDILPVALGMQKQNDVYVKKAIMYTTVKFIQIDSTYFFVACINTSVLKSEIGNQIFSKYVDVNFSNCYSIDDQTQHAWCSLRSTNDRTDVSEIAKIYKGGGHRNASGLFLRHTSDVGTVIDVQNMYSMLNNIYIRESETLGNVVYLNATHCRKQIGKYLLQTRYYDKNINTDIQECCSVIRNRSKNPAYFVKCNYSCVFSYDGNRDVTWFSVYSASNDAKLNVFSGENDYNFIRDDSRVIFTRRGCQNQL